MGKQLSSKKRFKDSKRKKSSLTKKAEKRLRRSSLVAIQKDFEVFNHNEHSHNEYENLLLDVSDNEAYNDTHKQLNTDTNTELYDNNTQIIKDFKESNIFLKNQLDDNDDFIAISSSEDEGDNGAHNIQSNSHDNNAEQLHSSVPHVEHPWVLNKDHTKEKEVSDWLTEEIKDFIAYISPTRQEIELRNITIKKIRNCIRKLWNDSNLYVFGSYATDLYLPGSDMDCVVVSKYKDKEDRQKIYQLSSWLKRNNLATNMEVIAKARVPIIKFIEPNSNLHIDISFERTNGLDAARTIRNWLDSTPGLRELTLVVKQFLATRRLNDVHLGGLGGLSTICMVYSFLNLHPRLLSEDINAVDNLGVLLLDFFELYGKNFGYDHVALSFQDDRAFYIPKSEWRDLLPMRTTFALAIQDPNDPTNNVSRSSYNLRDIKRAFTGAFDMITKKCYDLDGSTFKDRVGQTILGKVIKFRGPARDFRDERHLVINKAIEENEVYHRERGRIIHKKQELSSDDLSEFDEDDIFMEPSSDEDVDVEEEKELYNIIYKNDRRPQKKNLLKVKPQHNAKIFHRPKILPKVMKKSIDIESMMGLPNDQTGSESDGSVVEINFEHTHESETSPDTTQQVKGDVNDKLRKATVDSLTRRTYWLSKGQDTE